MPTKHSATPVYRPNERGAALITVLLISMLLLAGGGALIMTTAMSVKNAYGSTPETQAYYAAEAGAQAALGIVRGSVAPSPLFNTTAASAAENKITFRQMESTSDLSRWLTYNSSYSPARVTLTNNYTPLGGMAYNISATDPDNTRTVIFSVSGSFPQNANNTSITIGTTNSTTVTIAYTPPTTNPATVNLSGSKPLGSFQLTPLKSSQFASSTISTYYPSGIDFNLTITQTAPLPATSAAPIVVVIPCKITGVISSSTTSNTAQLTFPNLSNDIGGAIYSRTTTAQAISYSTATTLPQANVTAPNPYRLIFRVTGFGPNYAEKRLQLMVNRFAFSYTPSAAITLRGADSGISAMTINVGNSSQYTYTGNDNAGGAGLPAFVVTNGTDLTAATTAIGGGTQITGSSQVQQVSPTSLSSFLQTAQGARDLVNLMRESAQTQYWPAGSTGTDNDRYFPAGTTPSTFGADVPNGLFTFVDGDAALSPAGGAGLLVVTGTLDMRGSADFKGLILVLGAGQVLRNGGGNGTTLGSIVVAKFDSTGGFLAPTFDSNGGGTSDVKYDSKWVENALMRTGPRVVGISEY
jgi:hypothetical protein